MSRTRRTRRRRARSCTRCAGHGRSVQAGSRGASRIRACRARSPGLEGLLCIKRLLQEELGPSVQQPQRRASMRRSGESPLRHMMEPSIEYTCVQAFDYSLELGHTNRPTTTRHPTPREDVRTSLSYGISWCPACNEVTVPSALFMSGLQAGTAGE